jgi:hypothetical protein
MAEPFHCIECEKPVDLATAKLAPLEAAAGELPCLLCFYKHHTGTPTPTEADLPEGWDLELWEDLPVRRDDAALSGLAS